MHSKVGSMPTQWSMPVPVAQPSAHIAVACRPAQRAAPSCGVGVVYALSPFSTPICHEETSPP